MATNTFNLLDVFSATLSSAAQSLPPFLNIKDVNDKYFTQKREYMIYNFIGHGLGSDALIIPDFSDLVLIKSGNSSIFSV